MASNGQDADEQGQPKPKLQIYPTSAIGVSSFWREKYERDAKKYWDVFYKRHQDKFFKDRHYLDKEWGQYFSGTVRKIVLEIGCGVGNTIFPLLATYPDIFVYACDFSPRAIDLVKTQKDFTDTRVTAFVCDLTTDHLGDNVSPSSVDIVTMIFVLSAVSPEKMSQVLLNIRKVLKPTGHVLFRDYATGDLAQRAFYFSNEFLTSIFKENGFEVKELSLCCKQVENRSRELVMNRRWVQAVFCLSEGTQFSTDVEATVQLKGSNLAEAINSTEFDLSDGVAAEMFGFSFSNNNEIMEVKIADLNFKIEMLSKEYQHTCKSTGLMLWEAAHLMATVLAINPAIVARKRVLELVVAVGAFAQWLLLGMLMLWLPLMKI